MGMGISTASTCISHEEAGYMWKQSMSDLIYVEDVIMKAEHSVNEELRYLSVSETSLVDVGLSQPVAARTPQCKTVAIQPRQHRKGQSLSLTATIKMLPSPSIQLWKHAYRIWQSYLLDTASSSFGREDSSLPRSHIDDSGYSEQLFNSPERPADEELLAYKNILSVMDKRGDVRPVHHSMLPSIGDRKAHCFRITKLSRNSPQLSENSLNSELSGITRYYSTKSTRDEDAWMLILKRAVIPEFDRTMREENSLKLWIQEVKHVPSRKKYYCEVRLDETLYAKSTAKLMTDMLLWSEEIHLRDLPKFKALTISVKMAADERSKRKKSPICVGGVTISLDKLRKHERDQWYLLESSESVHRGVIAPKTSETSQLSNHPQQRHNRSHSVPGPGPASSLTLGLLPKAPLLRLKAHWRSLQILPQRCYDPLRQFLGEQASNVVRALEAAGLPISPTAQEEFSHSLVKMLHVDKKVVAFLVNIILWDLRKTRQENLTLRGNSFASKSMECYLLHIGDRFLKQTLGEFINSVITSKPNCEVDPLRVGGHPGTVSHQNEIKTHRQALRTLIENVWSRIASLAHGLPKELHQIFASLRQSTECAGPQTGARQRPLAGPRNRSFQIISSSLFLRLLCPAILSPSLFGLADHYPEDPRVNRTLTLVAKTIQTLANATLFGYKESYMVFLNEFLKEKTPEMEIFLNTISDAKVVSDNEHESVEDNCKDGALLTMTIDQCHEMALLESMLRHWMDSIPPERMNGPLKQLSVILSSLSQCHKHDYHQHIFPLTMTTSPQIDNELNLQNTLPVRGFIEQKDESHPSTVTKTKSHLNSQAAVQAASNNQKYVSTNKRPLSSTLSGPPTPISPNPLHSHSPLYDEPYDSISCPFGDTKTVDHSARIAPTQESKDVISVSAIQQVESQSDNTIDAPVETIQKILQLRSQYELNWEQLQKVKARLDRLHCENLQQVQLCRKKFGNISPNSDLCKRLNRIESEATRHICFPSSPRGPQNFHFNVSPSVKNL